MAGWPDGRMAGWPTAGKSGGELRHWRSAERRTSNAMLTINKLIPQARGLAPVLVNRAATVELGWNVRQKSRFDAIDSQGRALGIFLPRGTLVRGGDMLVVEDGTMIIVRAAPQPVLVVAPAPTHGTPFDLLRAAYHLGNRHVPVEIRFDHLKLEPDHVLAEMLQHLGLVVSEANAPFEPEGGAYGSSAASGQAAHAVGHEAHVNVPTVTAAPHVNGPGCGHGHRHGHDH